MLSSTVNLPREKLMERAGVPLAREPAGSSELLGVAVSAPLPPSCMLPPEEGGRDTLIKTASAVTLSSCGEGRDDDDDGDDDDTGIGARGGLAALATGVAVMIGVPELRPMMEGGTIGELLAVTESIGEGWEEMAGEERPAYCEWSVAGGSSESGGGWPKARIGERACADADEAARCGLL
jgi:hypothetical protein